MAKGGALKPVYAIDDADLRVNGGQWELASQAAIPVIGYDQYTVGALPIKGGAALPVWPIEETDLRINGGSFNLMQGRPIKVMDFNLPAGGTLGGRNVQQGPAIPVYAVLDDNKTYDATWPLGYAGKVLGYGPIAYWPLWDAVGAAQAEDISGNGFHGTPNVNVTFGQDGIGDGRTSALFSANSYINVFSAGYNAVFNGNEGAVSLWFRVLNIGVWTDGFQRTAFDHRTDAVNQTNVEIDKRFVANQTYIEHRANNVARGAGIASNEITWLHWAIVWSNTGNYVRGYKNGALVYNPGSIGGLWAGNLLNTHTVIGALTTGLSQPFNGWIAHVATFDDPLTGGDILDLATI